MVVVKRVLYFAFNVLVNRCITLTISSAGIGSDHHVDAFQVSFAFEIAAIAVHCAHTINGALPCDRDDAPATPPGAYAPPQR